MLISQKPALRKFALAALAAAALCAQTAPPAQVAGEITELDAVARRLALRTDAGATLAVAVRDTAVIRKSTAGEDITQAVRVPLDRIAAHDRVVAIGDLAPDGKSLSAWSIIATPPRQPASGGRRSVSAQVIAVDLAARAFTLQSDGVSTVVRTSERSEFRRFDGLPASLADLRPGDRARVEGAERVTYGTFRYVAAVIRSVNPATGELEVEDGGATFTVRAMPGAAMKRLPPLMAAQLGWRCSSGGGVAGIDLDKLFERLPPLRLAELKPGGRVLLSLTRETAVMLLAGVEPLLEAAPTAAGDIMGAWSLDALEP